MVRKAWRTFRAGVAQRARGGTGAQLGAAVVNIFATSDGFGTAVPRQAARPAARQPRLRC